MTLSEMSYEEEVYSRGSMSSVVQSFAINGLYGYRSISLASPYAATILIAQNGSGKTTLLGALNAFLRGQFARLKSLDFVEIRCRLKGLEVDLVLRKDDISELFDQPPHKELARISRISETDITVLLSFILNDFEALRSDYIALSDDPTFSRINRSLSYTGAVEFCSRVIEDVYSTSSKLSELRAIIKNQLSGLEVVYLPTYRRVEVPIVDEPDASSRRRRPRIRFSAASGLYVSDIQFGLRDISERLSELNQEMLFESNNGYRHISAKIINDLIDGTFESQDFADVEIPDKDELNLFFARLKEGGTRRIMGPIHEVSIPSIDKIYRDEVPGGTTKFLRYFLGQLSRVMLATRNVESRVEDFVQSCNKYLGADDPTAMPPKSLANERHQIANLDYKALSINRRDLSVSALSVASGRRIPLDSLSSGEKQMVSLFARLFLYPNDKIVLIDEPELSLSIEWQRHIMPDVLMAPSCRQAIAITHSPFIFENALEPFARSMQLAISREPRFEGSSEDADD